MEARIGQALIRRLEELFQSKMEIAEALQVSRQTVYGWLEGKFGIDEAHKEHICNLLKAANLLIESNVRPSRAILKRLRSFSVDPVNEASAIRLIAQLKIEETEAIKLGLRLAGRDKKVDFSDAGIPMLQE